MGSPQVMKHKYAAPVRCLFLPGCACLHRAAHPCVCLSACLFACLCVLVYLSVRVCVRACRTSQQEQPKCIPLMSSCGRPPTKSQRLAPSTPLPQCHLSSLHFLLSPPLTPPPLSLSLSLPSYFSPSLFVIFHHLSMFANLRPFSALRLNSSSLLGSCAEGYRVADREEERNRRS